MIVLRNAGVVNFVYRLEPSEQLFTLRSVFAVETRPGNYQTRREGDKAALVKGNKRHRSATRQVVRVAMPCLNVPPRPCTGPVDSYAAKLVHRYQRCRVCYVG